MSAIIARFYVAETTRHAGNPDGMSVVLRPVMRATPDNIAWSKFTPSGEIRMNVTTANAAQFYARNLGKDIAITMEEIVEPDPRAGQVDNVDGSPSADLRPATTAEIDAAGSDIQDAIAE